MCFQGAKEAGYNTLPVVCWHKERARSVAFVAVDAGGPAFGGEAGEAEAGGKIVCLIAAFKVTKESAAVTVNAF